MNVRLRNDFYIKAGIWFEDEYTINNYTVTCDLITATNNESDHITCLNRIGFLFDQLNSVCFIHEQNQKKTKQLRNCDLTVVELPQEPVDQIIGLVIFYKINAICEERMLCTELDISSELGQNIHYLHSINEESLAIPKTGWWRDSTPNLSCLSRQTNEKIVKFAKVDSWQQYDLNWDIDDTTSASVHNINEN
jgi:hypothetical protein